MMLLHIPHSSTHIPYFDGFITNRQAIEQEIFRLTDWFTDELFDLPKQPKLIAPFSRVFCDVERFEDDDKELMASFGMGVLYQRTDSGGMLREISPELREKILSEFYRPHHIQLLDFTKTKLAEEGKCLIVDCHSFPMKPFNCSFYKGDFRPDFNIGTDSFHTPQNLVRIGSDYFKQLGYTVGIDIPYSGSIVPLDLYKKDDRLKSIMLEVNRSLYMHENKVQKNKDFDKIKNVVFGFLDLMKEGVEN